MDKSMLTGLVVGGLALSTAGALAMYRVVENGTSAEVLAVEPLTRTVKTPRQVCADAVVSRPAPTQDPNRVTGTAIGAVVGGLLGNQVGKGTGRTLATVAGAAAGGYAGHEVQEGIQKGNTVDTVEKQCSTVYDTVVESDGYRVHYRLGDREGTVHMDNAPGSRIPAEDGRLLLEPADG